MTTLEKEIGNKRIIDGKIYDIETSQLHCEYKTKWEGSGKNCFSKLVRVYITKNGQCFFTSHKIYKDFDFLDNELKNVILEDCEYGLYNCEDLKYNNYKKYLELFDILQEG